MNILHGRMPKENPTEKNLFVTRLGLVFSETLGTFLHIRQVKKIPDQHQEGCIFREPE
jgi:hypothetical protein